MESNWESSLRSSSFKRFVKRRAHLNNMTGTQPSPGTAGCSYEADRGESASQVFSSVEDIADAGWSSDSDEELSEGPISTAERLRNWCIECNIPGASVDKLLKVLSVDLPMLPKDHRTLLKIPPKVQNITNIKGGQYCHRGLERSLRQSYEGRRNVPNNITLVFNVDGLPIHKSTCFQSWVILGKVFDDPSIRPFVIGVYYGKKKPTCVEQFLLPFIEELRTLMGNGMVIDEKKVSIECRSFICDSPARAFIKGCVNFNSYHGCLKCTVVGKRTTDGSGTYPPERAAMRTDADFRALKYEGHYKTYTVGKSKKHIKSPLLLLDIDIVQDVPVFDPLHLLHIGVMKRLLTNYKTGATYIRKWKTSHLSTIDSLLEKIRLPREFNRRTIQSITHLKLWKATECASFLNYVGVGLLRQFLSSEHYLLFLHLFCAVTLCSSTHFSQHLSLAQGFFDYFIEGYFRTFGKITSNIHCLVHITEEVERFGPLPDNSTYPFENFLHTLKRMVRSGRLPLQQISNRIEEISMCPNPEPPSRSYPILQSKHQLTDHNFSTIIIAPKLILNNRFSDQWFMTEELRIVAFHSASRTSINGREVLHRLEVFEKPMKSSAIYIFKSPKPLEFSSECTVPFNSIFCKLVAIELQNEVLFVPLQHTLPDSN